MKPIHKYSPKYLLSSLLNSGFILASPPLTSFRFFHKIRNGKAAENRPCKRWRFAFNLPWGGLIPGRLFYFPVK
jgi:hypothetical protein